MANHITRPTLLLDETKCRANIQRMAQKAKASGVRFQPHGKTHQSHIVAGWLKEAGAEGITVSSVAMAEYFAGHGWKHITIAIPANVREAAAIDQLAAQVSLHLLVESVATVKLLGKALQNPVSLYIEIDTGYGRTGVPSKDEATINALLQAINETKHLQFKGFYVHAGHSYHAGSTEQIKQVYQYTVSELLRLKQVYQNNWPGLEIVTGDTPCCSLAGSFEGLDAISPGNFVFYDMVMYYLGACREEDIAVAMACPVIATYPHRGEVVIHGGAIHFSKDTCTTPKGQKCHAVLVEPAENGWGAIREDIVLKAVSQEHGTISCPIDWIAQQQPGDLVYLLPAHSCLTANLMKGYTTLEGEYIEMMR